MGGGGTRWLTPVPSPPLGRGCLHSSLWQNLPNWSMRYGGCWLEGRAQPLRLERGEARGGKATEHSNRSHPENTRHVGDLEPSSSVMMIKAAACLPDRPVCYPAYLAGGWLRSLSVA